MDVVTECRRCGGKASDSFLCARCTRSLGETLGGLPWWLHRLTEAALGHTRMSDNAGRKTARRRDLDGDLELAACIEPLPKVKDDDLDRARREREKAALRHALAAGGINARASELLAEIADSLAYWCRVIAEERGLTYAPWPIRNRPAALGQDHAEWLRAHLHSIAASESADDIAGDVEDHAETIIAVVNRPIRIMDLGECSTWNADRDETCGYRLRAPADAIEVYCPRCRTTHNCHRLMLALMDAAEREVHPWSVILRINRNLPTEYQVAQRTLQHWRASGLLRARQWQRPDKRKGITRHTDADVALYSWADVKRLQLRKPQRLKTGAAAHQS
jgi:hypothetical protein